MTQFIVNHPFLFLFLSWEIIWILYIIITHFFGTLYLCAGHKWRVLPYCDFIYLYNKNPTRFRILPCGAWDKESKTQIVFVGLDIIRIKWLFDHQNRQNIGQNKRNRKRNKRNRKRNKTGFFIVFRRFSNKTGKNMLVPNKSRGRGEG